MYKASVGGSFLTKAVSILHMILFQLDFGLKRRPISILKNICQVDSYGTPDQRTVVKKIIENQNKRIYKYSVIIE